MNTKTLFLLIPLLLLLVCGCPPSGPKLSEATGKVTLNGEPLPDVRVQFVKTDSGALSFAETDAEGKFTLRHTHGKPGAEPGTYRVTVFRKGKMVPAQAGQEDTTMPDEPVLMSDKKPIEVVVTEGGPQEFNIDIK